MSRRMLVALIALAFPLALEAQDKVALDHEAYEIWRTIEDEALSRDGRWVMYRLVLQDGDAELVVRSTASDRRFNIPRGRAAGFTPDSRFVVALIAPEISLVRQAKREKKKDDEQPKDSLAVLDLGSGETLRVERVKSYKLPEEAGGWLGYLLDATAATPDTSETEEEPAEAEPPQGDGKEKTKAEGTTLVLRALDSGVERQFRFVTEYALAKDGAHLAFATSTESGNGDGVFVIAMDGQTPASLLEGEGVYKGLAFDDSGEQLAFLSNRDDYAAEQPAFRLYHWRAGMPVAASVAAEATAGVPEGWWVSEHGDVSFSQNGARLFFGTAPRPEPEPEDSTLDEERVTVDIWNWKDPYLQPMQAERLQQERRRAYRAVVHLRNGRVAQLATAEMPEVEVGQKGDAETALGSSDLPYRQLVSWDYPGYSDYYLVDVASGEARPLRSKVQGSLSISPGGRYAYWWDNVELAWYAGDIATGTARSVTAQIPYPLHDEDHDSPSRPDPFGDAGWTDEDREFLVYDRYDVWAVDPEGRSRPRNVTDGYGRRDSLRFRYVRLDRDRDAVDPDAPLLLSAFHYRTKAAGFFRDRVRGDREPERLVFADRMFSAPSKAREGDLLLFTRSTVAEFPDLWVSGLDVSDARKISDANPQQSEYRWATVELVEWTSVDGVPLQGLLYKPADFDPSQRYPMIVTFYEKDSHNLHQHYPPIPHRSVVRPTFYASRGYLMFVPDIVYRAGYPGESALNAVVSGTLSIIDRGYVDRDNIGIQGHSWGGYQIAYIVTRTNLFKAAAGGAPVANMISAYGGIRWGTGMSRMFQYERTQSRIGATLWEAPMRYIENSPIFWADKIETPLLMMHNDRDHAVPWYQGIEMFVALRRLGKPAWLVNYNGDLHWPTTHPKRRDWNIRLQQFFDHYLKGAPPPVWLAEGVPAAAKGRTLGLELTGEAQERATGGGNP